MMITRDQLASWADTPESKANFPHLISRLIRATNAKDTKVDIPWGSATYIGGWDGIVDSKEKTRYVPEGISLWELGTDQNPKKKADADYEKRTKEPLGVATREGHHVLVPLGADDVFSPDPITLPAVDRDALIEALVESGLSRTKASKYTKESGHDITILKKLLGFPSYGAAWINTQSIRELIPALLLGRWDEGYPGDIELLEKLYGTSYAKYKEVLAKWLNLPESPLKKIGETWRLTSPLDLWRSISVHLLERDFQLLEECFIQAYHSGNSVLESQMDLPDSISKKRTYSDWVREGLTQSLILISIPQVEVSLRDPQSWVDRIIGGLLSKARGETWVSINRELPLIAEASPQVFLQYASRSLSHRPPEIMDMFKEKPGVVVPMASHTGLLWALEELAWMPLYFKNACLLLHKLATLDPGGSLANRPLNSLTEIFKAWHHQTLASYEERVKVLREMLRRDVDVSWKLLKSLLPNFSSGTPSLTHRMRWRVFWEVPHLTYTYREIFNMYSEVVDMLISLCDGDETRFSDLIEVAPGCMPRDRERILKWVQENVGEIRHEKNLAWHTLRRVLNKHKLYPDANWALRREELYPLELLYNQLQPDDVQARYMYLFNEDIYYEVLEPSSITLSYRELSHDSIAGLMATARERAVAELVEELGVERVLELRLEVKSPSYLGEALAKVIKEEQDLQYVWQCLEDDAPHIAFAHGFISQKLRCEGFSWMQTLVKELLEKGYSDKAVANVLVVARSEQELWQYIETLGEGVYREYWLRMYPIFNDLTNEEIVEGINKLLQYRRFSSAVREAWLYGSDLPSSILIEVLRKWGTEEYLEPSSLCGCEIGCIFKELNKRSDVEKETHLELETLYLPLLTRVGAQVGVPHLEEELASNPESFIQLLKWLYKPKDEGRQRKEQEGLSKEQIQNAAKRSDQMLEAWTKIPGMQEDGTIDETELRDWIKAARALAEECDRLEVADIHIGQLLAKYPEDSPNWPQRTIFQAIEDINTEELKEGYSVGMWNKRGATIRGAFEGGGIEHERAEYFGELASELVFDYPNVSELFRRLQDDYGQQGNRHDEMAERDRLDA